MAQGPPWTTSLVEAYLLEHRVSKISWHAVLNNHASTRPKRHGGPLVRAVTECKEFAAPGGASAEWRCTLTLPNSFAPGDSRRVVVTGEGTSKHAASEHACLGAVASLISESPSDFLLRPAHWKVSPDVLVANLPGVDPASGGHQALPVHTPATRRGAGEEADAPDADARLVALVRDCLVAHGGEIDPSRISHNKMGLGTRDERVYEKFNKLLAPGGLKAFVESHSDEFTWNPKASNTGMVITWAHVPAVGTAPQEEGDVPAVGTAPQEEADAPARPDAGVDGGTSPPSEGLDALD